MPKKITLSKKHHKTSVVPTSIINVSSAKTKARARARRSLSRRYLNGYHYWVDANNIIYDDEVNEFARMGCIDESGEFCWD